MHFRLYNIIKSCLCWNVTILGMWLNCKTCSSKSNLGEDFKFYFMKYSSPGFNVFITELSNII